MTAKAHVKADYTCSAATPAINRESKDRLNTELHRVGSSVVSECKSNLRNQYRCEEYL